MLTNTAMLLHPGAANCDSASRAAGQREAFTAADLAAPCPRDS